MCSTRVMYFIIHKTLIHLKMLTMCKCPATSILLKKIKMLILMMRMMKTSTWRVAGIATWFLTKTLALKVSLTCRGITVSSPESFPSRSITTITITSSIQANPLKPSHPRMNHPMILQARLSQTCIRKDSSPKKLYPSSAGMESMPILPMVRRSLIPAENTWPWMTCKESRMRQTNKWDSRPTSTTEIIVLYNYWMF